MTVGFLRSYSLELIRTCHRRGAFAMGGMAAQIPIKNDPEANEAAIGMVRADKEREAGDGHDGTWVAHPGLVPVALEAFDRLMPDRNQLARKRQDVHTKAADLLAVPGGTITEKGVRNNISVGIQYTEAWLRGNGCVPIGNLMEDAATAEICRSQLWQWRKHGASITGGAGDRRRSAGPPDRRRGGADCRGKGRGLRGARRPRRGARPVLGHDGVRRVPGIPDPAGLSADFGRRALNLAAGRFRISLRLWLPAASHKCRRRSARRRPRS